MAVEDHLGTEYHNRHQILALGNILRETRGNDGIVERHKYDSFSIFPQ